jgi:hypothetical protein
MSGIDCILDSQAHDLPKLTEIPIDVEVLFTMNETSLLETNSPQHQVVVEVSPVHGVMSEKRLTLLSGAASAVDFTKLDGSADLKKKLRKLDPPRIEILARRVLNSVDISCKRVRLSLVKDVAPNERLTLKLKEIIMEECISDFLSVVSCFDFSLPNEEALSSAMQICIGRLVGIGLNDDEAWGCTNAARLNFLDDVALMRRAQSDVLLQLSNNIRYTHSQMVRQRVYEDGSNGSDDDDDSNSFEFVKTTANSNRVEDEPEASPDDDTTEDESDNDTANSVDVVETTLNNAVEKTIASFSPLLHEESPHTKRLNAFLVADLPLGVRLSAVKLFYDKHITSFVPSLVVTNSAGIELLTLVPSTSESDGSLAANQKQLPGHGIVFSRFELDKHYGLGSGGLPMSVLLSDEAPENNMICRERSRLDDIVIGEIELLFSSKLYEEIIEEISKLRRTKKKDDDDCFESHESESVDEAGEEAPGVEASYVAMAFCVSMLMTSDELVPFSRLTLEGMTYKDQKASVSDATKETPSFTVVADAVTLQNLTPEGQFYPDSIALLSPDEEEAEYPFQMRYFKSPDPWKHSSRLEIDFRGYRVFLIRQFLYELIHYLISDRYGVGRLKKKYSTDVRDKYGNQKPPLLYSINILDSAIICPRCSSSSDMVSFEVGKASIFVSYQPESFSMPTESSPFEASPSPESHPSTNPNFGSRRSSDVSASDFFDCMEDDSDQVKQESSEPVSSFDNNLKKRLTFKLERFRAFTAISPDSSTREIIESPLFRFFHVIDGRAEDGKSIYSKKLNVERQPSVGPESFVDAERCEQYWEEISTNFLNLEVFADYAPHLRLLIADHESVSPFSLNARLSQFCLLLSVWYSNMQELPAMFPFVTSQVEESSKPPTIPKDFPGYGTAAFVSLLEDLSIKKSEICCIFKKLTLRCTFDRTGHFAMDPECFQYFDNPNCPEDERPGMVVSLSDAVIHVIGDFLNLKRIGIGASAFDLIDERRSTTFQHVLSARPMGSSRDGRPPAWADVTFGLRDNVRTLSNSLPQPFQISVYMTPGWSLINVGSACTDALMFELSWIWIFLGYFKSFFTESAFGNPGHVAEMWAHKLKNSLRKTSGQDPVKFVPPPGMNVDFRLWLCQPILCIPSDYRDPRAPCLRIECKTGLWYRYKSIRDFSSQEVVSTDINLYFLNEFQSARTCRRQDVRDSISGTRALIEGLSFGLRYDSNNAFNHKDISLQIPFLGDETACSVIGREIDVQPMVLVSPTVCNPFERPTRFLGPKVCEITCIIDALPVTLSTMTNFFTGPPVENNGNLAEVEEDPATFSVSTKIADLRLFAIDPVLGVQLPVAVVSISSVSLTASKFALETLPLNFQRGESRPEDLQVTVDCHLWADYFKLGITRSWEPFLEPFKCLLLYEKSNDRGQGFSLDADSPFHLSLTGALLQIMGETIESFSRLIGETFGEQGSEVGPKRALLKASPSKDRVGAIVEESISTQEGFEVVVLHEIPRPLKSDDRVAFSLRNLTGQKIRIHQQTDLSDEDTVQKPAIVTYLNQVESMGLAFAATVSVIKNLTVTEVPYPGLPNSSSGNQNQGSLMHAVDVQVPGFRWLQGIKIDTFGRKFEALTPRSGDVLAKIFQDWRLKNAMMLLTEVGLESGGRLVTIRSLFEVRNNTTHPIKLVLNPDPTYQPTTETSQSTGLSTVFEDRDSVDEEKSLMDTKTSSEEIEIVEPGEVFQIPILLLERALRMPGSHLGSLWVCPDTRDKSPSFLHSFSSGGMGEQGQNVDVGFCSRPVQLAKVVHESDLIFQAGSGEEIAADKAKSGVQVSCPTSGGMNGDGHAPFCYAVEVARSPIVSSNRDRVSADIPKDSTQANPAPTEKKNTNATGTEKKTKKPEKIHIPVAYTLSIHAPLVIVNLLPEGGRFELMHAIRRTVLWFADLEPGQQVPVHSVGLDAPLLLLVNLGFCRTPVGEGALVHHGTDAPTSRKGEKPERNIASTATDSYMFVLFVSFRTSGRS